jgi:hypothetical protein
VSSRAGEVNALLLDIGAFLLIVALCRLERGVPCVAARLRQALV